MLSSLLQYEQSSGIDIPTNPFDLVIYIRNGVGKDLAEEEQKNLYIAAVAFLEAERRQPVAVAPTAALLAAHDKAVPPAIPMTAAADNSPNTADGGLAEDDEVKNATTTSMPQINVLDATARATTELARKPSSLYGNPSVMGEGSVGPNLSYSAKPPRPGVTVTGESPKKGVPVPRTIRSDESVDGSAEAMGEASVTGATLGSPQAMSIQGAGVPTRILQRRTAANHAAPLAIGYTSFGGSSNQQQAANMAAHPNVIAVDEAMSNISRATTITAGDPLAQQVACQELFDGPDSEVAVSSGDLLRVASVGAYVLMADEEKFMKETQLTISSTGTATASPVSSDDAAAAKPVPSRLLFPAMNPQKRFRVEAPLHLLSKQDPFYIYEVAEQTVERADGCTKTLFEASEGFERAGQSFASLGLFRMAANCEVRKYDCLKATNRLDDAGQALVTASHYHTQETLANHSSHHEANDAALAAMQNAIGLYDEEGREVTAAKLCTEAAELCLKARNPGLGVDVLHVAAQTFLATGQNGYAEKCFQRAAEIAIFDLGDFAEAIDTLEKLAKITPPATQFLVYFKALLCRFVCIPPEQGIQFVIAMEDCHKTLELYTDICPALLFATREYNLLREVLGTQKHMEEDKLEQVISMYIEGNRIGLERWTELLLKKIHDNLVQRKASVEKLYKLVK